MPELRNETIEAVNAALRMLAEDRDEIEAHLTTDLAILDDIDRVLAAWDACPHSVDEDD